MARKRLHALAALLFTITCILPAQVKVGADLLLTKDFDLIKGKRIGLITNHSALLADGRHLADALAHLSDAKLVALFGPEHGIRGDAADGATVTNGVDAKTQV